MRTIALTVATSLAAMGLVGMSMRGPADAAGARVAVGDAPVREIGTSASRSATATLSSFEAVSSSAVLEWTPTPEPGRVLAPGETIRVLPLEVWRASLVISEANRYELVRACWCESRWQTDARGAAGEEGACQVIARFHGPVPADLRGQFAQASRIAEQHGMGPWTTKDGCAGWNAK